MARVTVYENNFNRPVQTGLLTDATTFSTELSIAYSSITYPSTSSNFQLLTQTWYDNYTWQSGTPLSSGFDGTQSSSSGFQAATNSTYPPSIKQLARQPIQCLGLLRVQKNRILGIQQLSVQRQLLRIIATGSYKPRAATSRVVWTRPRSNTLSTGRL